MYYNGEEHVLWVDFNQEIIYPAPSDRRVMVPILNEPYNTLMFFDGKAELYRIDYDLAIITTKTPCTLSPIERENLMRLYYPI